MDKNHPEIPEGDYCYKIKKVVTEESGPRIITNPCPHYGYKDINGVTIPFCKLLKQGSVPNDLDEDEWERLIEHFGSEEKAYDALPLFVLWDGCKECGINNRD